MLLQLPFFFLTPRRSDVQQIPAAKKLDFHVELKQNIGGAVGTPSPTPSPPPPPPPPSPQR